MPSTTLALDVAVVASAHGAALRGERLAVAIEPGQDELDTLPSPLAS